MTFVFTVIGFFLGAVSLGLPGAVLGGCVGYLLATLHETRRKLRRLEESVDVMKRARPPEDSAPLKAQSKPLFDTKEEPPFVVRPGVESPPEIPPFRIEPLPPPRPANVSEPRPSVAIPPSAPSDFDRAWSALRSFMTGGNLLVKVGVVILFFGVSFLLRYAVEHNRLPIELRLAGVAVGGIALLVGGWRLRKRRPPYAMVLQGGGVGVLYLTIFAALRLYALLPPALAFALLAVMAALSATLAVLQNAMSLAVLGVSGGFLAPVLASTGSGSHVALFSFYALLDTAILGIASFRAWRPLNVVGFAFTFVIGASWGARYYRSAYFATVEPFLIFFFLLYVAVSILFCLRQKPELKGYVDGTLVFGTPLVAFALQAGLVHDMPYGMAVSALALGTLYIVLAWGVFQRGRAEIRTLAEAFLALGVIFATLAIPLAFDGRWTAAAWALEGAGIVWIGVRQGRISARIFGIVLQLASGLFFFADIHAPTGRLPVLNGFFLGCMIISFGALFTAGYLDRRREAIRPFERGASLILLVWGLLWFYGAGLNEIKEHLATSDRPWSALCLFAFAAVVCSEVGRRLAWKALRRASLVLLPAMLFVALLMAAAHLHPAARGGFPGWLAAFGAWYAILRREEDDPVSYLSLLHAAPFWLLPLLVAWEGGWQVDRLVDGAKIWSLAPWGVVPALIALAVVRYGEGFSWPLRPYRDTYLTLGCAPLILFAVVWSLFLNLTASGDATPLPYAPIVNPLDLTVGLVMVAMASWWHRARAIETPVPWIPPKENFFPFYGALLFLWLNAILVRTVHHWGHLPFRFYPLAHSVLLQAVLSLAWTLTASGLMVWATRRGARHVWLTGGGLLVAVVVKLFFVDLSGTGTVARIVSFIGVGCLLLAIGYFSPVPPKRPEKEITP